MSDCGVDLWYAPHDDADYPPQPSSYLMENPRYHDLTDLWAKTIISRQFSILLMQHLRGQYLHWECGVQTGGRVCLRLTCRGRPGMIPCKHIVIVRHGRERVFGLELSLTTFWSGHTHTYPAPSRSYIWYFLVGSQTTNNYRDVQYIGTCR